MTAVIWPSSLRPEKLTVDIEGQSKSGGVSASGFEQPVVGSAGRITIKADFQFVGNDVTENTLLAARAMKVHLRGRANTILMPIYDQGNSPASMAGEDGGPFNIPHSDGSLFSDGAGFDQSATPAHAGAVASQGDGSIIVLMEAGHSPQPGQWFGLKNKEIYSIDTVADQGANQWLLTFSPTLRRDVDVGEKVDFDDPHVECRAASDATFPLNLQPPMYGVSTLEMVEAPP